MTSHVLLAQSTVALATLPPASSAVAHPAHATRTPPPPKHTLHTGTTLALTPATTRVRADRTDGRLALTFV
jgi:hypothetical protein